MRTSIGRRGLRRTSRQLHSAVSPTPMHFVHALLYEVLMDIVGVKPKRIRREDANISTVPSQSHGSILCARQIGQSTENNA